MPGDAGNDEDLLGIASAVANFSDLTDSEPDDPPTEVTEPSPGIPGREAEEMPVDEGNPGEALVPLLGMRMAVASVDLGYAKLVRARSLERAPDEVLGSGENVFALIECGPSPQAPLAATEGLRRLVTTLRLLKPGGVGLCPTAGRSTQAAGSGSRPAPASHAQAATSFPTPMPTAADQAFQGDRQPPRANALICLGAVALRPRRGAPEPGRGAERLPARAAGAARRRRAGERRLHRARRGALQRRRGARRGSRHARARHRARAQADGRRADRPRRRIAAVLDRGDGRDAPRPAARDGERRARLRPSDHRRRDPARGRHPRRRGLGDPRSAAPPSGASRSPKCPSRTSPNTPLPTGGFRTSRRPSGSSPSRAR